MVFHKDGDDTACLNLLATAKAKHPVKVFGVSFIPTHFPQVVQPAIDTGLSPFMQYWMTSHVLRYVLRNPIRARLVGHAMDWPWSSLPSHI